MKILILSWRCIKNPDAGGSELYFHELAKRWVEKGNKVIWFSSMFPKAKKNEIVDGINIVRAGGKFSVYIYSFLYCMFNKIEKKTDVIIDIENGIPFFSPLYIRNKEIILHIHHLHKDVWFKELSFPISLIGFFISRRFL